MLVPISTLVESSFFDSEKLWEIQEDVQHRYTNNSFSSPGSNWPHDLGKFNQDGSYSTKPEISRSG